MQSLHMVRRQLRNPAARAACAAQMRGRRDRLRVVVPLITRQLLLLTVAAEFGISVDLLRGIRRLDPLVAARQVFALIAKRKLLSSTTQIGDTLGERDHTTIMHALRRAHARELQEPEFAARVALVELDLWPACPRGHATSPDHDSQH